MPDRMEKTGWSTRLASQPTTSGMTTDLPDQGQYCQLCPHLTPACEEHMKDCTRMHTGRRPRI